MDKTDIRILSLLGENPRTTFSEMAKKLDLSVAAIQHRLGSMESSGLILEYGAYVNLGSIGGSKVIVTGQLSGKLESESIKTIEKQGSIMYLSLGTSNTLFVQAALHRISDLDELMRFIELNCRVLNPEVYFVGGASSSVPFLTDDSLVGDNDSLTDLDCRIMKSIHKDARKPFAIIANEVGASTKTVKKRLAKMLESNRMVYCLTSRTVAPGVLGFDLFVKLRSSASRVSVAKSLRENPLFNLSSYILISNVLDMLYVSIFTETVKEASEIINALRNQPEVVTVKANLITEEYFFETWVDRMIEEGKIRSRQFKKNKAT